MGLLVCSHGISQTHPGTHTHTHTAPLPEQWPAVVQHPGSRWGFRCLAQGHLSGGGSGFDLATLRLPVQLLNQYAKDVVAIHISVFSVPATVLTSGLGGGGRK